MYEKHRQNKQLQPNSPTAQQPNSPTAQQIKLKSKWLLSFCLILLSSFSSNSLVAQITFAFDASDDNQSTITKTVSGVTLTLSNEQPDDNFDADSDGLAVLGTGPFATVTNFEMSFSSDVQILSYNIDFVGVDGNETITLTDGTSTSTENSPFSTGNRNFDNQFCVAANTTINVSNLGNENTNLIQVISITVQPSTCPSSNPEVPTLSEWGLIILALLLMTLGTLYLVQPSTRFEQEH